MKRPRKTPCEYRGWRVWGVGGFITVRCYYAEKGERVFHQFMLRDTLDMIDQIEDGTLDWEDVDEWCKRPAYV